MDRTHPVERAVHDVALAALLGGNLFGRLAMNPALSEVSDEGERGRVLNRTWRRYGIVNSLALGTLVAERLRNRADRAAGAKRGWRLSTARAARPGPELPALALANDVALGTVIASGLGVAAAGYGFSQQAPGGAVPMRSGHDPAPQTPPHAVRLKRMVNLLGTINLLSELALAGVEGMRRA